MRVRYPTAFHEAVTEADFDLEMELADVFASIEIDDGDPEAATERFDGVKIIVGTPCLPPPPRLATVSDRPPEGRRIIIDLLADLEAEL